LNDMPFAWLNSSQASTRLRACQITTIFYLTIIKYFIIFLITIGTEEKYWILLKTSVISVSSGLMICRVIDLQASNPGSTEKIFFRSGT